MNADITPKGLSPVITAANKTYNKSATASATCAFTTGTGAGEKISGDDVLCSVTAASFNDANAGIGKTVTATLGALTGAQAGNYQLNPGPYTDTADIDPKTVTVVTTAVADKVYDGNTSASVTGCTFTGVETGDQLTCSGGSGTFDNKNVGVGKTVTVQSVTLGGASAANYTTALAPTNGGPTFPSTSAAITAKPLAANVGITTKTYDGTTAASISGCSLTGVVSGDVATCGTGSASATFNNKNAGTGKAVTVTGLTLGGTGASNYSLASGAATTGNILAKAVTVAVTAPNKVYDGNANAPGTTCAVSAGQLVAGDAVTCAVGSASFDNRNPGDGKTVTATGLALGGVDGGNYSPPASATTTASITSGPSEVTITKLRSRTTLVPGGDRTVALANVSCSGVGTCSISDVTATVRVRGKSYPARPEFDTGPIQSGQSREVKVVVTQDAYNRLRKRKSGSLTVTIKASGEAGAKSVTFRLGLRR